MQICLSNTPSSMLSPAAARSARRSANARGRNCAKKVPGDPDPIQHKQAGWRTRARLFYRYALRKVARLVDVGALEDRDVVGEELDRDRVEQGCDKRVAARNRDAESEPVGEPSDPGSVRNHHDAAAAGHDL